MFRSPLDMNSSPFPYSRLMGIGGDHSWRTMAEFSSNKLYVAFGVQIFCFVIIVLGIILGIVVSLLSGGSIDNIGLVAAIFAGAFLSLGIIVLKKLLRQLFATWRLISRRLKLEAIEQEKLRGVHL